METIMIGIKRLGSVVLIASLGGHLSAMQLETRVQLNITNHSLVPVKCKLFECEKGWATSTYHPASEVVLIEPGQQISLDVPAEAHFARYLYYGSPEVDEHSLSLYSAVPQHIEGESYQMSVFLPSEFSEEAHALFEESLQASGKHAVLRVRNTSFTDLNVRLFECDGGYSRNAYYERSACHILKPGELKELVITDSSLFPRFLYFEKGEIGRTSSYVEVPQVIMDKEHETLLQYHAPFSDEYIHELERAGQLSMLPVCNTSAKTVFVKLYEYEEGRAVNSYHERSTFHKIRAGEVVHLPVQTHAPLARCLYIGPEKKTITPRVSPHIDVPQHLTGNEEPLAVFYDFPMTREAAEHIRTYNERFTEPTSLRWAYRGSPDICDAEKQFRENRSPITEQAIRSLLSRCEGREYLAEAEELPTIALCTSGGGFRAMLSSIGFMDGLRRQHLLDTITYTAALSGSTWIQAAWLAHARPEPDALPEVVEKLCASLEKGLFEPRILEGTIGDKAWLALKNVFAPQIPMNPWFKARFLAENGTKSNASLINSYGMRLAEALFPDRDDKYSLTFSELAPIAQAGRLPLPILTAVSNTEDPSVYEWVEMTPFETGYLTKNPGYIPMCGLGRDYTKGFSGRVTSEKSPREAFNKTVQKHLVEPLCYKIEPGLNQLVAACGSAFSVTTSEAVKSSGWGSQLQYMGLGARYLSALTLSHRNSSAMIAAFDALKGSVQNANLFTGLHLPNFYDPSKKGLELRDAGIHFNLPLIPLCNPYRNIDIIVVMDASSDVNENVGNALKEFRKTSLELTMPLPKTLAHEQLLQDELDKMKEQDGTICVFREPGKKTVVYIVSACNDEQGALKYDTFKLKYSREESHDLIAHNEELARQAAECITSVIADKTEELN